MNTIPGTQTLRLRRAGADQAPADVTSAPALKPTRHEGLLQDQLRRAQRGPWTPGLSVAFRMLMLVRFSAAMYSNIQDCDEVYNFWEPLHFLDRGYGFQTWELSPAYAIRSWAYILLHLPPSWAPMLLRSFQKRSFFFAVRVFLAGVSAFCEARFYRTVVERMNYRLGRYMLFFLLLSAGMWNAAPAFLPSSFAMYTTTMACSFYFKPVTSSDAQRTLAATVFFAAGAIIGWPFSIALALPYVFEELFVYGGDRVPVPVRTSWFLTRLKRLVGSAVLAATLLVPVIGIDSLAYGKLTITPWNIIKYNIFGGSERGPDLYGTEPWYFYFLNLLLNFNILVPLALLSLPALFVTYHVDPKRLGSWRVAADQSSPFTLMALRLAPLYVWLGILTAQKHKEERFMFPAYPLLCFNAATTLYLMRGWMEVGYIKVTKSPYKASTAQIFRLFTLATVLVASALSLSRIAALYQYYHAPFEVARHLEYFEIPRLLNVTGLLPDASARPPSSNPKYDVEALPDISAVKLLNLNLCIGKEWHRFPGHYHVPDGINVKFIKSEFDGLLPGHFMEGPAGDGWWRRPATRFTPPDQNDLNREEMDRYVDVKSCDYLIDLDFPSRPAQHSPLEPRYAVDPQHWDRVACFPFLDASMSSLLTRTLWMPGPLWRDRNTFGDYCLLRNVARTRDRESNPWS